MSMRSLCLLAAVLLFTVFAQAQIEVLSVQKLDLGADQDWYQPRFSPDGKSVYMTNSDFDGIWQYSLSSRDTRQITEDPKSGYGYSFSPDGQSIAYRRTFYNDRTYERTQEIVILNMQTGSSAVQASQGTLSVPVFAGATLMYAEASQVQGLQKTALPAEPVLLGTEKTKIALLLEGQKIIFDPLKNGRYIWPALSPDKQKIVTYAMDAGTIVADLQGNVLARLGRRDAAVWTRSGRWLAYMDDRDDGHQTISSDLRAVSPDGLTTVQLTSTPDVKEMYPQCSPTDDSIVFSTAEGDVYVLTYREVAP